MQDVEPEARAEQQRPGDNCPRAHQENKSNDCYHRPDDGDAAGDKIENALKDEPSPALVPLCALTPAIIAKTPSTSM